ncbi:MAG: dTMP kinase [Thermoplasmata archaeon]
MTRRMMRRGRLLAIEGIDGSGKSTLARALARSLRRRGLSVGQRREPSDPTLGALAQAASVHDPWTGGVYFTVDRHLARPALERALRRHDLVVTDRSYFSTLAYQGSALPPRDRRRLAELQRRATVVPDLVVLLDLEPAEAIRRLGTRSLRRGPLERRRVLARTATAYRALAARGRWIVVDARRPTHELVRAIERRWVRELPAPERGRIRPRRRT